MVTQNAVMAFVEAKGHEKIKTLLLSTNSPHVFVPQSVIADNQ